jgi:hypothetical protein
MRGVLVFLLFAMLAVPAHAERRVALVVGNSAYSHAPALPNPRNDAEDVAGILGRLGFEVVLGVDQSSGELIKTLQRFSNQLQNADVGLFFYAGHGVQVNGVNYLIPIDAEINAQHDLQFGTVKLDFVLELMERETKTNLIFLDACRNNPLARNLVRSMGTRAVTEGGGLAPVASGVGTFLAYATQPNNVAADGQGRNSPFTAALKKHMITPDLSISDVMIEVRKEVIAASNGTQVPWDHSAMQGRFYFASRNGAAPTTPPPEMVVMQPQTPPPPAANRNDQAVYTPPRQPSRQSNVCGWYAIHYCSQSREVADSKSAQIGGHTIDTSDPAYPNFSKGWFCSVIGPLDKPKAEAISASARSRGFPTAYVKNPC